MRHGQAARLAIADGSFAFVSGFPARERAHERCGADTRVRSQAPLVTSGVASAFLGDGQKAVVPGVRDGWSPLVDVFFKC